MSDTLNPEPGRLAIAGRAIVPAPTAPATHIASGTLSASPSVEHVKFC